MDRLSKAFDESEHPRDEDGKWTAGGVAAAVAGPVAGVGYGAGTVVNETIVKPLRYAKQLHARTRATGQLRSGKPTTIPVTVFRGAPQTDVIPVARGYNAVYFAQDPKIAAGYAVGYTPKLNRYRLAPGVKLLDTGSTGRMADRAVRAGKAARVEQFVSSVHALPEQAGFFAGAEGKRRREEYRKELHRVTAAEPVTAGDLSSLHTAPGPEEAAYLKQHGYHGTIGNSGNIALFDTSWIKHGETVPGHNVPKKYLKAGNRTYTYGYSTMYRASPPQRKRAAALARSPTVRFILRHLHKRAPFSMSYQWNESEHPRADDGKFTSGGSGGAPSFRQAPLREASPGPQRSLTRGESWQRIGAKIAELPQGYTGSTRRELPADSFKRLSITNQIPKAIGKAAHDARNAKLRQIIAEHREPAIEQGRSFRRQVTVVRDYNATHKRSGDVLLAESVPHDVATRAYNFAALRALHQVGAHKMDYNLSDAQKAELEPLTHFIRHVERRLYSAMTIGDLKGSQVPYLKEFGEPFKDNRGIGVSVLRSRRAGLPVNRGTPKLRFRPQQEIIKRAPLAKATPEQQAKVRLTMSEFKAGRLRSGRKKGPVVRSRAQAIAIALSQAGLSKAFDESEHPRDDQGQFTVAARAVGHFVANNPVTSLMAIPAALSLAHPVAMAANRRARRLTSGTGITGRLIGGVVLNAGLGAVFGSGADMAIDKVRGRNQDPDPEKNLTWLEAAELGLAGGTGLFLARKHVSPTNLRMLASNVVGAVRGLGGAILPGIHRRVAARELGAARTGLRQARLAGEQLVYRGTPVVETVQKPRNYQAVYFAPIKRRAVGYGTLGAVGTFGLKPGTKLLDTSGAADLTDPIYDQLLAAGTGQRLQGGTVMQRAIFQALARNPSKTHQLSLLHTAPTEAQAQLLREAGYHGSIGASRNVALLDTGRVRRLYSQNRLSGALHFPKAEKLAKFDETRHRRAADGKFAISAQARKKEVKESRDTGKLTGALATHINDLLPAGKPVKTALALSAVIAGKYLGARKERQRRQRQGRARAFRTPTATIEARA